jgi:hypothetical protein
MDKFIKLKHLKEQFENTCLKKKDFKTGTMSNSWIFGKKIIPLACII